MTLGCVAHRATRGYALRMRCAFLVVTVALVVGACSSESARLESTWQRFEQRQQEVIERWETLPIDAEQRRAHAMPDQNPVARVAALTSAAGLAYMSEDLPMLTRALEQLEACDAELTQLVAAR